MAASPLGRLVKYAARSTWGLTFDMSGGRKQAKLAGRRPLDGRVRHLPARRSFLVRAAGLSSSLSSHNAQRLKHAHSQSRCPQDSRLVSQ